MEAAMANIREVTNPSDRITINYDDKDAARLAVLVMGRGCYGISGDDGMPVFILGGCTDWVKKEYGKTPDEFCDSIPKERVIVALESFQYVHERTSTNGIVDTAHELAAAMKQATNG
jgi:hypothetical protein